MLKVKNYLIVAIAVSALFCCQSKRDAPYIEDQDRQVVIGKIDSLYSNYIDEYREFWVYVPASAMDASHSDVKYPVLYLLDGEVHFHFVSGMVHQLSSVNLNMMIPEMIVVGINNTDRDRDLVPSFDIQANWGNPDDFETGGGGNFMDFIEYELIPHIDSTYQTSSYRLCFGHSLGGLTALHTLLTRPAMFNDYAVIEPSLWRNNGLEVQIADSILQVEPFKNKSLYIAAANDVNMDVDEIRKDTTWLTWSTRFILDLTDLVEESSNNGLTYAWKFYENDIHSGVVLNAAYDALRFFFSWYNLNEYVRTIKQQAGFDTTKYIGLIKSHYIEISERLEYIVLPPEFTISNLGTRFLFSGDSGPDLSRALFNLNLENYPMSPDAWTQMGAYYLMIASDTVRAIECYSCAVGIDENHYAGQILEELKSVHF